MSCSTLNTTALELNVSVANLPEGFCPATMQELANAIGERLIISPNTSFNTFAIGSTAPASNIGPWYKDCNQWFVYDDGTGTYVPIANTTPGGFRTSEYHTTSGSFTVPDFIYRLKVQLWGGGGGGGQGTAGVAKGGGGAGGYAEAILTVTPGQVIPYTIGGGGAGGGPATSGGTSTFSTMTAGGGTGNSAATIYGAVGGTATGGTINITGGSGGPGGNADGVGGSGGNSPQGGQGGQSIAPVTALANGIVPGGGGAGSYDTPAPGAGAGGAVLITY